MTSVSLPVDVLETAVHSGQELGWRKEHFPGVLKRVAAKGIACIGGQFQWVFPDGTCEAYWLNADASPRQSDETWHTFVARCEQQVFEGFTKLVSSVNFEVESERFDFLKAKKTQGVSTTDYLVFVAYFSSEDQDA